MGQTQSKDNKSISQQEQQQNKINHPKFTSAALSKDNELITITLSIQNQTDFYIWQKNLNTLTQLDDQTFLLPKAYQFQKKSICGTSGTLKIEFDDYRFILYDELENRRNYNKHFEEQQLWYLLYSLVTSSHHLNRLNKKVGDIRPKNIFINDAGQLKVATLYSWPNQKTNVEKFSFDKIITFIAPQQLQQIRAGKVQTIINKFLAQSFSIGLTALNTGLLDKVENLYNIGIPKFDNSLLQKKLNKWIKLTIENQQNHQITSYSNPLKEVILALCQPQPKNRISASDVYQWLAPYDENIFNLQKFQIGRPPVKKIRMNYNVIQNYQGQFQPKNSQNTGFNRTLNQFNITNKPFQGHITSNLISYHPIHQKINFSNASNTNKSDHTLRNTNINEGISSKQQITSNNTPLNSHRQRPNIYNNYPTDQNNHQIRNNQTNFILNNYNTNSNNLPSQNQQSKIMQLNYLPSGFQQTTNIKKYQVSSQNNNLSSYLKKEEAQSIKKPTYNLNPNDHSNNKIHTISRDKNKSSDEDDFLKKINEQLQKSKMLYP